MSDEKDQEIERLRARIAELEAQLAMAAGTMPFPSREEREAFRIAHDIPPSTPRE